ncbi:MAG: hypothetical protein NC218_04915 [Acetobacter sp.]|nr:hypothetical protein [Acetobacter sp.]
MKSELIPTPCSCKKALEAKAHNEQITKELEALANQANTIADKPSFSLAELLSVVSECVICQVEPIFTEDKVCEKIKGSGSAKERVLNSVTPEQAQNLCAAAEELITFLQEKHLAWEADISAELSSLAEKYNLPLEFTF